MGTLKLIFWSTILIVTLIIGSILVVAIPLPLISHLDGKSLAEVISSPMDILLCLAFALSMAVLLVLFLVFVFVPIVIKVQKL